MGYNIPSDHHGPVPDERKQVQTDPTSYLSRHRPICTVIEEIKEKLVKQHEIELTSRNLVNSITLNLNHDHVAIKQLQSKLYDAVLKWEGDKQELIKLLDEAKDYAQRMSARLMEYKRKETENGNKDS
jgi:hypothetical protein